MIELQSSGRLHHAMIEVTTECNLRCTYCAVSGPDWKPRTLDRSHYDSIITSLVALGTKSIILHGHGETTFMDGWEEIASKFLDAGFRLSICTNLSKIYSDAEFETFSRFDQITVSVDSIDPVLFKQLRKGGDIRHVVYNITRIQALRKDIRWIWSVVVCDQSIWSLFQLIKFGEHLGVKSFCFCNLTIEPGVTLRHLSQLGKDEAEKALAILDSVEAYCLQGGIELDIKSGLTDTLKRTVYGEVRNTTKRRLYPLVP